MIADFKKFIMRGNVVDLAVAVVIGAAFKAVVDSFVTFIINPVIAAIFGKPDVRGVLNITLRETSEGDAVLSIGGVLQQGINFLIIAAALFVFVRTFERLQSLRVEEEVEAATEPDPGPSEIDLLTEIRDSLQER